MDRDPYAPHDFSVAGHALIDVLSRHLVDAHARALTPVMPTISPRDACARFDAAFPEEPGRALMDTVRDALAYSTKLHTPRFLGHQVAAPFPAAALCDLVAAFANNGMAVFEMGPAASAMERSVLAFFARALGFPATSGGVLTSGGSLGNLTALLAARQRARDVWHGGLKGGPQLVVVCADGAHYSVARAARILGLGDAGVVTVPVDDALRMRADALADTLRAVEASGAKVMCVVANAGATTAGSYDPIAEIADLCASVPKDGPAWLHVDGAHGASLALSRVPQRRALLAGVERADSVVWDAHKMLGMPALVTAVLFRNGRDGAAAFAQDAGYLFDDVDAAAHDGGHDDRHDGWSDIGKRTIECTKRMMSLKLYACLQAFGVGAFRDHVDRLCDLCAGFAEILRARTTNGGAPAFELLTEPTANIVVFRRAGDDGGKTAAIRKRILAEGKFYIVQVRGAPGLWLRTAIMNPLTNEQDLLALADDVMSGP